MTIRGGIVLAIAMLVAGVSVAAFAKSTATTTYSVTLDDGWNQTQRDLYDYTAQGVNLMPAAWLEALEAPDRGGRRFMSPEHLAPMGFLYASTDDRKDNPYHWPVGFTIDRETGRVPMGGFNCALCHNAQIQYRGQAVTIDGGSTDIDPAVFANELQRAVVATARDPERLKRFRARAVALGYPDRGFDAQFDVLYKKLRAAQENRNKEKMNALHGPGHMDAVSSIANNIFAIGLGVPSNARAANAPVNAPYLWDMWLFDYVQYNSSASGQAFMNRDVSQVIGQGGVLQVVDPDKPFQLRPESRRWKTTVRPRALYKIRAALDVLKPPVWPEQVLGKIDRPLAASGRTLFEQNCARCHGVQVIAGSNPSIWHIPVIPLDRIGTDPNHAVNYAGFRFDATKVGLSRMTGVSEGLRVVTAAVKRQAYIDAGIPSSEWAKYDGGKDVTEYSPCGYRSRPLVGVWATGPFLHNGSVPTIYDLLSERRPAKFVYGSKEFDPTKLGFSQTGGPGTAVLDTRRSGNSNAGHWFTNEASRPGRIGRAFSDREKFAIIEYLKSATLAEYPTRTVTAPSPPPCADNRDWAVNRVAAARK